MGVAFSGGAARFPDIRFIRSTPAAADLFSRRIDGASANASAALPHGFIADLKRFCYDQKS